MGQCRVRINGNESNFESVKAGMTLTIIPPGAAASGHVLPKMVWAEYRDWQSEINDWRGWRGRAWQLR